MSDYDAIVIGAGAAGGIVACVLAEAGKSVLLLERGRAYDYADIPRDHLRNHRVALYGQGMGPDRHGHPRVLESDGIARTLESPNLGGYNNNAMGVGGGTRVYGAQAWRFLAQDFRMASTYGVPESSSLADWPFGYDELEPYYDRAEWEIGCSGDGDANRFQAPRRRGYPMRPVPENASGRVLKHAADSLGWSTFPVPLLINSAEHNGRPACVQCNMCVGFACPSNSKNGSQNTVIPRAVATGLCTLQTQAMAERIDTNSRGDVSSVTYLVEENGSVRRHIATAKTVVVSAGAIESARLLLNSSSPHHPHGMGNEYDQVGRNLQGHVYPAAHGFMHEAVHDNLGPGVSIATCQHSHGNPGVIGGAMLANDFIETPIFFWRSAQPPGMRRWGLENKRWMRDNYSRWVEVKGPVQEIPNPESRVTVDPFVRDKLGLPVARLSGTVHPETLRTAEVLREKAIQWLEAAGAESVWSPEVGGLRLSAGQHQAGTCRMGSDPRSSVVDQWGRVHGHDNLFVVDASIHVTNGGFNPVLTIMALAFRNGEFIANL
jgi:choline dehydrogenase-like flavoprotein